MPEHFYFAYGANMSLAEMHAHCPGARFVGPARLNGWRLVFTQDSARWLGGVADIIPLGSALDTPLLDPAGLARTAAATPPLSPVRGVLWDIEGVRLTALHAAQGYQPGRPRADNDNDIVMLELLLVGTLTRHVQAFAYTAVAKEPQHRMPHSGYMELVVSGAQQHGLPDDYCHQLAAVRVAGEDRHIHTRL